MVLAADSELESIIKGSSRVTFWVPLIDWAKVKQIG